MPWSKSILKKSETSSQVLEYNPVKFELGTPSQAMGYMDAKKHGSDFRMSDVVRQQTGVDELELQSYEQTVENRALEKLKEIQENAYQEGYKLGLDEGQKKAFEEYANAITERLAEMKDLTLAMTNMKSEILNHNESHIVQLLFQMASKLAQAHLEYDQEPVVSIIKQALELAHGEESIVIHVSNQQIEFLEKLKSQQKVELDFLEKAKFIANPDVKPGGCMIETNYGEVDARIEQRIQQLWGHLKENMPRVKQKLVG